MRLNRKHNRDGTFRYFDRLIDVIFFSGILLFLILLYGFISFVAFFGNSLVIWIVATTKSMHEVIDFYIANLAVSDVCLAIFCIPFQFYAALVQQWNLPDFMCKFCPFAQTFSINVNILTLIAIAQERYVI